jgi:hypothetical protein
MTATPASRTGCWARALLLVTTTSIALSLAARRTLISISVIRCCVAGVRMPPELRFIGIASLASLAVSSALTLGAIVLAVFFFLQLQSSRKLALLVVVLVLAATVISAAASFAVLGWYFAVSNATGERRPTIDHKQIIAFVSPVAYDTMESTVAFHTPFAGTSLRSSLRCFSAIALVLLQQTRLMITATTTNTSICS